MRDIITGEYHNDNMVKSYMVKSYCDGRQISVIYLWNHWVFCDAIIQKTLSYKIEPELLFELT